MLKIVFKKVRDVVIVMVEIMMREVALLFAMNVAK